MVSTASVEPGLVPHDSQSRSPMAEYPGMPVTMPYATRDIDPAIRQPYQGQMRLGKPGNHTLLADLRLLINEQNCVMPSPSL